MLKCRAWKRVHIAYSLAPLSCYNQSSELEPSSWRVAAACSSLKFGHQVQSKQYNKLNSSVHSESELLWKSLQCHYLFCPRTRVTGYYSQIFKHWETWIMSERDKNSSQHVTCRVVTHTSQCSRDLQAPHSWKQKASALAISFGIKSLVDCYWISEELLKYFLGNRIYWFKLSLSVWLEMSHYFLYLRSSSIYLHNNSSLIIAVIWRGKCTKDSEELENHGLEGK